MATGSRVHLEASQRPQYYVKGLTAESAAKASELLQLNHEKHHVFFNQSGFHNHIAHHLLTLFALNATPAEIQKAYDANASYQRASVPLKASIVDDMHVPDRFKTYLGKEKYYHDFLVFFQREIEAKSWQAVLNEYVFAGDARADDMLVRMYAGFLHPLIHLGFGIEFAQPAIVAEALAQAAVHEVWMGEFFLGVERAAEVVREGGRGGEKTIVQLLEECRGDEKLKKAPRFEDGNKIRDGVLKRAPEEMVKYAAQYTVREEELEQKTAEMINAAAYFTGAAQHPPHQVKFDFFYMHCVNSSIFFSAFLSPHTTFLTPATQRRLLEWKVWTDITMYVSRGSPPLLVDEITTYTPTSTRTADWPAIVQRANALADDDGHAAKLIRALAHGEQACAAYAGKPGFAVQGDMWLRLGHMAIESVEAGAPRWVRSCGFDEAWGEVPVREERLSRV